MNKYPSQQQVLKEIRGRLGVGAGTKVSAINRVSKMAGSKWLREGVPRERVPFFVAVTGIPAYVIRPDAFVPTLAEVEAHSHDGSAPVSAA